MNAAIYGNGVQIFQSPGVVTITYEMIHETRVIRLDNSPYPEITQFTGNARGHWEGDTLVVESRGFQDRTSVGGARTAPTCGRRSAFAASIPKWSSTASRSTTRRRTRRRSRCARCGPRSRTTTRTSIPATKATSPLSGGLAGERALRPRQGSGDRGGQTAARAAAREHLRQPRGRRDDLRHQRRRVGACSIARATEGRSRDTPEDRPWARRRTSLCADGLASNPRCPSRSNPQVD